jgi:hypothetical protein
MLGYYLEKNLPALTVSVFLLGPTEWDKYVQEQYTEHGWSVRLSKDRTIKQKYALEQLVWYNSGELIGNTEDFLSFVESAYGVKNMSDDELLGAIALENEAKLKPFVV